MRLWLVAAAALVCVPVLGADHDVRVTDRVPIDAAVSALSRQRAGERGVEVEERRLNIVHQKGTGLTDKSTGWGKDVAKFGNGGIVAMKGARRHEYGRFLAPAIEKDLGTTISRTPVHTIDFPRRHYTGPRGYPHGLPPGKKWGLSEETRILEIGYPIAISDPPVVRALLSATRSIRPGGVYDGTPTTLYEGTITLAELNRASIVRDYNYGTDEEWPAKVLISWRLWIGKDNLVRRLWSSWREPSYAAPRLDFKDFDTKYVTWFTRSYEVRLSRWGRTTRITAPPPAQVATPDELCRQGLITC